MVVSLNAQTMQKNKTAKLDKLPNLTKYQINNDGSVRVYMIVKRAVAESISPTSKTYDKAKSDEFLLLGKAISEYKLKTLRWSCDSSQVIIEISDFDFADKDVTIKKDKFDIKLKDKVAKTYIDEFYYWIEDPNDKESIYNLFVKKPKDWDCGGALP